MKNRIQVNSLLFKIVGTVVLGILCLSVALSAINIAISKKVFVENFSDTQKQIFEQVNDEFFSFYLDITEIFAKVKSSDSVRKFLSGDETEVTKNILDMKQVFQNTQLKEYSNLNVLLVGTNGKTYLHNRTDKVSSAAKEILASPITKCVIRNQDKVVCEYRNMGFTDVMKREPVVIFASAVKSTIGDRTIGYMYITIKEEELNRMYNYFTSDTSDIIIFNQDDKVISSNNLEYVKAKEEKKVQKILAELQDYNVDGKKPSGEKNVGNYFLQQLQSTNYKMLGIINPEKAFSKKYNVGEIILFTCLITVIIVLFILLFIRQQTRPLSDLANKMVRVSKGKFDEYVKVEGTEEVRKLSESYNSMLTELNKYVEQLITIEEEKRIAEIHALQMQINPHYMYNTLASVKWLIWQGDTETSTRVIDAFISLLRNTISNTDEFITVEHEIENLKNYVFINQTRYGDKVNVEYFMHPNCAKYKMPKLILQPFVENAFFHAFPEGQNGSIQVYVKEDKEYLKFEIVDDGVGINMDQLQNLKDKKNVKDEHFTGIGVNNVDDRIKLVYGMDYGVMIVSEEGKGTVITVLLPKVGRE